MLWIRIQSGSRRAKMTHKRRIKLINFICWSARCSLLKDLKIFSAVLFSTVFGRQNPGSGLNLDPKKIHLKCRIRIQRIRIHSSEQLFLVKPKRDDNLFSLLNGSRSLHRSTKSCTRASSPWRWRAWRRSSSPPTERRSKSRSRPPFN